MFHKCKVIQVNVKKKLWGGTPASKSVPVSLIPKLQKLVCSMEMKSFSTLNYG